MEDIELESRNRGEVAGEEPEEPKKHAISSSKAESYVRKQSFAPIAKNRRWRHGNKV
jgi:hypothetical protein